MNGVRWLIFASEALALEAALIGMTGNAIIVFYLVVLFAYRTPVFR
jgi:hypothetical protein